MGDLELSIFTKYFNSPVYADCKIVLRHQVVLEEVEASIRVALNVRENAISHEAEVVLDVQLVNQGTSQQHASAPANLESDRLLYGHAIFLGANSSYFEAKLANWSFDQGAHATGPHGAYHAGGACMSVPERPLPTITLDVEEAEVELMQAVIAFMYTGALPPLDIGQLTTTCKLADMFGVDKCIAHATNLLGNIRAEDLEATSIAQIYNMPEPLQSREGVRKARDTCIARLLQLYGSLHDVLTDEQLLRSFLYLPYAAVHAFVLQDELAVRSENEVLLLLHCWVSGAPAARCLSKQQRQELSHAVRLMQLTPTYLLAVVPRLKWLCVSAEQLRMASHHQLLTGKDVHSRYASDWKALAPWNTQAPRKRQPEHKPGRPTTWVLQLPALEGSLVNPGTAPCKELYHNGFVITMRAELQQVQAGDSSKGGALGGPDSGSKQGAPAIELFVAPSARVMAGALGTSSMPASKSQQPGFSGSGAGAAGASGSGAAGSRSGSAGTGQGSGSAAPSSACEAGAPHESLSDEASESGSSGAGSSSFHSSHASMPDPVTSLPLSELCPGLALDVPVWVAHSCRLHKANGNGTHMHKMSADYAMPSGWGFSEGAASGKTTASELLQPYLVEGQLRLDVAITSAK